MFHLSFLALGPNFRSFNSYCLRIGPSHVDFENFSVK